MGVYARILRAPNIAMLVVASTVARVPFAINGLAIILFLNEEKGSFAAAGLVAGAIVFGGAIGGPLSGRLVDRRGARMLLPIAVGNSIGILSVYLLGSSGAPTAAIAVAALFTGALLPPTGSVLRARWPELLAGDEDLLPSAYALDSVTIEISFITGPLITAAIVALAGPGAALLVSSVLVVAGVALFVSALPPVCEASHPNSDGGRILGPLSSPAIRMLALTTLPFGFCIGTVEVSIPAFSEAAGNAELAGILLAVWSAGSAIGGLIFGVRPSRRGIVRTYVLVSLAFPLACLPLAAASSPLAMGALVVLAGAPIAPLIATRNELTASVAPAGTATESFTWVLTSLIAGLSTGTAVGGAVIEARGWHEAVLLGVAVAAAGALLAVVRRGRLRTLAGARGLERREQVGDARTRERSEGRPPVPRACAPRAASRRRPSSGPRRPRTPGSGRSGRRRRRLEQRVSERRGRSPQISVTAAHIAE